MKKKMLSIRRASFYAMLRGGLLLLLINFLLMGILSVVFTYYSVKGYEYKLALPIMTEYSRKQIRLRNISLIVTFLVGFGISAILEMFLIFMFASKASRTITEYAEAFAKYINKASKGEQKLDDGKKIYYREISGVIDDFIAMTDKIKQREEELENSNHELTIANKEIKSMVKSLGEKEKQMKDQYIQIIWTLLNLLEIKDQYTAGHSRSVTIYAVQIAKKLNSCYGYGLDIEKIKVASTLHDIGKISIDNNILNKPSRLTNEEFEIIKTHTIYGYYALKDIDNLKEERNMVKYHHEKYDGSGYPDGKKGDEIPLGARIICVADSFDAMTSNRPYRDGMPMEKAISELMNNTGKQFDPFIVKVFTDILNEQNYNEPVLA